MNKINSRDKYHINKVVDEYNAELSFYKEQLKAMLEIKEILILKKDNINNKIYNNRIINIIKEYQQGFSVSLESPSSILEDTKSTAGLKVFINNRSVKSVSSGIVYSSKNSFDIDIYVINNRILLNDTLEKLNLDIKKLKDKLEYMENASIEDVTISVIEELKAFKDARDKAELTIKEFTQGLNIYNSIYELKKSYNLYY